MAFISSTEASKKEKFIFANTLCGLVKTMENFYTTVDLQNEHCVTGKIVAVDAYMNLEMEDVIFYDMRGNKKVLANFYICGRNIRHIHIPKKINAVETLRNQLESFTRRKDKRKGFKKSRAEKKNLETVQEAYRTST